MPGMEVGAQTLAPEDVPGGILSTPTGAAISVE
jgi:hypothetical protein